MTTFYQVPVANTHDDPEQAPIPNRSGSISVTISNGQTVTDHGGNHQYNHANLARDAHGDNWRGTAQTTSGRATAEITRDTLVTLGGIQARVQDFLSMGALREVAPGQFEESTGGAAEHHAAQPVQAPDNDTPPLEDDVNAFVGDLLSPVPQHAVEPLMNSAAHAVATGGSMDGVAAQLAASVPDMSPEQAKSVIGYAVKAFQDQADAFLTAPGRVARDDLEDFYAHVRNDPAKMQHAINQQRQGSMAGWRSLVDTYQSATPPAMAALHRAGFEVRNTSGTPEVRLHGQWVSVHGAARAGLI